MARSIFQCFLPFLVLLSVAMQQLQGISEPQLCIVYMGSLPPETTEVKALHDIHLTVLQQVVGQRANGTLLHNFKSFDGFIAYLTPEELQAISGVEGVVSAFKSGEGYLQTTKSWDFLGFPQNVTRSSSESDIIVGVIDSGVWPNSSSFADTGFGPPPAKWKGSCETSANFTCNNKLIGARYYNRNWMFGPGDVRSPLDTHGHGTHTASIVAGNPVEDSSLLNFASGTARGGVPSARIAVYKVCWLSNISCQDADILSAFDDAIADGVDVISVSIDHQANLDYVNDSTAIGSFHALQFGILTSSCAGNSSPRAFTVSNVAPWLLTVAASTIDRRFSTAVLLGNNMLLQGVSINTYDMNGTLLPLIRGRDAPNIAGGHNSSDSALCNYGSLDQNLVESKIVVCERELIGDEAGVLAAGAAGTVMLDSTPADATLVYARPAAYVPLHPNGSNDIFSYINSTRNPMATISRSNELTDNLAPDTASFSSRGPNMRAPQILKPDIAAPGVHILAAWPPIVPPSEIDQGGYDKRVVNYNIFSGTSMACPHATGAAAYVKSFHPSWSPAAVKSALMTTAHPMNSSDETHENGLAYGAGNLNPNKATDPGLIYDASVSDFVAFLCRQPGYTTPLLQNITSDNTTNCASRNVSSSDLNLPSFALFVPPNSTNNNTSLVVAFHRSVVNVGSPQSTYVAKIATSSGLNVDVEPKTLTFTSLGQTQTFVVCRIW